MCNMYHHNTHVLQNPYIKKNAVQKEEGIKYSMYIHTIISTMDVHNKLKACIRYQYQKRLLTNNGTTTICSKKLSLQ